MVLRQFMLVVCIVGLALSSWAQSNYKKESSLGFFIGANAAGFRANLNENADVSAIQYQRDRSGIQFGSFLMHDAMKNVKWQYGLGMVMQYHLISYTPVPVVPVGDVEHWSANLFVEVAPLIFIGSEEKPGARPYVSPAVRGRYDINYEEGFFRPVSLAASFAVGLQSSTNVSDDKNFHLAPELKIERDLSNRYQNDGVSLYATTIYVSIKFY